MPRVMFKTLTILITLCVLCAAFPDKRTIEQPPPDETANDAISEENTNQSSDETDNGQDKPAIASATSTTASIAALSALGLSSTALREALLIASTSKSIPTTLQHHILPAETIRLPLTITTQPGLRTILAPETITIHQPTIAKIGEVIQKIPTAVSHQSQTIVHNHARVVTPIVAPAVRTIQSQIIRAYHTPLLIAPQQQTPILRVINNQLAI